MQYRQYINEINSIYLAAKEVEDVGAVAKYKILRDEMAEYYEWTQEHYDSLMKHKSISPKLIEKMRHHVESLQTKIKYEKLDIEPLLTKLKQIKYNHSIQRTA